MKQLIIILALVAILVTGFFYTWQTKNKSVVIGQITTPPITEQLVAESAATSAPAPTPAVPITPSVKLTFNNPFVMTIDKNKKYSAILKTTVGDITVDLAAVATPITVNNFVNLALKHFYDNTIFHRVVKDFMIQGGDPEGTGMGGPGYKFADESFQGDYTRGVVAMANSGPNTNGSQFFIMHSSVPLPKNYVIFGHVISGIDVVDKIAVAPVTISSSGEPSEPINPVTVQSVEIIVK